ncbi:MAG: hypothetical protein VB584_04770 [Candidatus Nitrosopelagicus sp.]
MGKMTCIVCGVGFFSPDDSPKCGKCREQMSQEGHEEGHEEGHSCGCGHGH